MAVDIIARGMAAKGGGVTEAEKAYWNGKQDAISDLDTIRGGAALGDTAVQPADIVDMATETWVAEQGYITEEDIPVMSVNGKTGVVVLTAGDLGLTNIFTLKGSKPTVDDLPESGNTAGDVWYVISESVGYIWLNDGTTNRWEQLGISVDLSNYVTTQVLASTLNGYVTKVAGKGLSTNDFTDVLKQKLEGAYTKPSGGIPASHIASGVLPTDYTETEITNLWNEVMS